MSGLRRLSLTFPPPHPAHMTTAPQYPRLTPSLQQVIPKGSELGLTNDTGVRAIGREGLALGAAWEDLEELQLEGLSLQGVSQLCSDDAHLASGLDYRQSP